MNSLSKLKISLYLAAIFLAGAVSGGFVTSKMMRRALADPPNQEQMASHWCAELESRLALTPDQLKKIRPIVNDALAEIKITVSDRLAVTFSNYNARIACELTPEQRKQFEQMTRECRDSMQNKLKEPPGQSNSP